MIKTFKGAEYLSVFLPVYQIDHFRLILRGICAKILGNLISQLSGTLAKNHKRECIHPYSGQKSNKKRKGTQRHLFTSYSNRIHQLRNPEISKTKKRKRKSILCDNQKSSPRKKTPPPLKSPSSRVTQSQNKTEEKYRKKEGQKCRW